MKINSVTGVTSFVCIICEDSSSPCVDCIKEQSVFNTAFKAGKNNTPSKESDFEGFMKKVYQTGYAQGSNQSEGKQHANA